MEISVDRLNQYLRSEGFSPWAWLWGPLFFLIAAEVASFLLSGSLRYGSSALVLLGIYYLLRPGSGYATEPASEPYGLSDNT